MEVGLPSSRIGFGSLFVESEPSTENTSAFEGVRQNYVSPSYFCDLPFRFLTYSFVYAFLGLRVTHYLKPFWNHFVHIPTLRNGCFYICWISFPMEGALICIGCRVLVGNCSLELSIFPLSSAYWLLGPFVLSLRIPALVPRPGTIFIFLRCYRRGIFVRWSLHRCWKCIIFRGRLPFPLLPSGSPWFLSAFLSWLSYCNRLLNFGVYIID